MSIKTSTEEWVRKGPAQAIAVFAAAGLVVGAVIGLGAGYKIEQNRTRSDVKRLQQELKPGGGKTTSKAQAPGQRVGKVTVAAAGTITLSTTKRGTQVLHTTSATLFEKATPATIAAVQVGRRVLVSLGAREIIVLPAGSNLGRAVTAVASDSISLAKGTSSPSAKLKTTLVKKVETLKSATAADVKVGAEVLAGGNVVTQSSFNANEVIVLLAGSAFAI